MLVDLVTLRGLGELEQCLLEAGRRAVGGSKPRHGRVGVAHHDLVVAHAMAKPSAKGTLSTSEIGRHRGVGLVAGEALMTGPLLPMLLTVLLTVLLVLVLSLALEAL